MRYSYFFWTNPLSKSGFVRYTYTIIARTIAPHFLKLLGMYPIVTVTGPRQSGKTTLAKNSLPDWQYVSLEDPDMRSFCKNDCKGFLETFSDHTIIDEAQRVPELFSYLQTHVDSAGKNGMYVLTGSQNMNMMESISQSLAGRTSILKLLPFSYEEQKNAGILPNEVNAQIFTGSYPRIFDSHIPPAQFCKDYIELYVERDVRQLLNIQNLADDCGIGATTAKSWLSILETSFIIYFLKPDFRNFSKRLVKSPKLYFCDTGVACSLLEIQNESQLLTHYLRGNLFENLAINRFRAAAFNRGEEPDLTFWRDKNGVEIDLLTKSHEGNGQDTRAWEIKAGATYSADYFKNLKHWSGYSGIPAENCSVIYTGQNLLKTKDGVLVPWSECVV